MQFRMHLSLLELTGIGGGTVGSPLRKKGFAVAVWSTLLNNAHKANEKTSVQNMLNDAQVIAELVVEPKAK